MLRFIAMMFNKVYEPLEIAILKGQIERLESQNTQLFDRLLRLSEPEIIPANPVTVPRKPRIGNWMAQKRELEEQDRVEANILKKKIEEEEQGLGLGNSNSA